MSRSFKVALCLMFLLSLCVAAFAQNGNALTLEECINIGLKDNSLLKNAIYQVDRAGANVKGSYASVLPRVSLSLSSGRDFQGATEISQLNPVGIDSVTGEVLVERSRTTIGSSSAPSHSAVLSYRQTLFDFGRNWNSIKQAKASYDAMSSNLMSARQFVYSNVKQRYFELLKAINLEEEFKQAVGRSKEQLGRTQSMFEIGSVAQVDVYRSEVTLGNDEINYINQQNIVRVAKANLNVAMGRDPETSIQIVEMTIPTDPSKYTLEEALSIAEQNNPNLTRFEYDMQSSEYGRKAAKGAFLPSIDLSLNYFRSNTELNRVYGDPTKDFRATLDFSFSYDLFNGMSDAAEISRQSANYSIAKENWINERRQTHLNVKQSYINLRAFDEISKINERNLRAAEEEYRLAQERYRVGAGTQLEVTEAQVSLTRARVQLVRAKYDAMISQAQLEAAMGITEEAN
ncbi:TolC family protein [bacterium]|nr:TolC family protein [bacterium]